MLRSGLGQRGISYSAFLSSDDLRELPLPAVESPDSDGSSGATSQAAYLSAMSKPRFERAQPIVDFSASECAVSRFWDENRIFEKSLELRKGGPRFIFNEGPPTANGLPHNGHVLTRVFKDVFLRYRTMTGHHVPRKAGWDTHGLPVEVEVEKELGIHGKEAIERYGVERFVRKCMDSVFRYTEEWEKMTRRVGFWVDLSDAYVTYHKSYVESVWWALARLFRQGLLYRGHKIVWWWPQGGTALSAGEVGLGYKTVEDPSVYVALDIVDEPGTAFLVWTTTPWTLPANQYIAVRADFDYVRVRWRDRRLILAAALVESLEQKIGEPLPVEREFKGADLLGVRYHPPFPHFRAEHWDRDGALRSGGREPYLWKVLEGDFVTLDSGTGLVHEAPAFGEVDYDLHLEVASRYLDPEDVPLLCPVRPDGTFDSRIQEVTGPVGEGCGSAADPVAEGEWRSRSPRESPSRISVLLACRRRSVDPVRPSRLVRANDRAQPRGLGEQRCHPLAAGAHRDPVASATSCATTWDWALSRERYWGTPLNVWINDVTGTMAVPPHALRSSRRTLRHSTISSRPGCPTRHCPSI